MLQPGKPGWKSDCGGGGRETALELGHQGPTGQREEQEGNKMPQMMQVGSWRHKTCSFSKKPV